MKRKVIQIADSTQLVSLPRKWCKQLNIKKGDEIDVIEKGNQLIISTKYNKEETAPIDLNIQFLEPMTIRIIHAMYKKGIDEIKIHFEKPSELELIQKALGKETVGYEIVEQTHTSCIIKNVSGDLENFDQILRRTFLLLITMAEEGLSMIKDKNFSNLAQLLPLEESNNRFTTTCRRYLNKHSSEELVGPLYCIVEDLEKIADQYKYMYSYLLRTNKIKLNPATIKLFENTAQMLNLFYSIFYKLDKDKIAEIGKLRKETVKKWYDVATSHSKYSSNDLVLISNMLVIAQQIFNITGPLLTRTGESLAKPA